MICFAKRKCFNPLTAKINNLIFYPLEVVFRWRDPYSFLFILRHSICKYWCLNTHFIPNNSDLIGL